MLDLSDLENEAELLAATLRARRCCDALLPCYRCSLLRFNVLARRRVVEIPARGHSGCGAGPRSTSNQPDRLALVAS